MAENHQVRNLDLDGGEMNLDPAALPVDNAIHQGEVRETNADPPAHTVRNDIQHREAMDADPQNVARNQQVPSGPGRNDLHDEAMDADPQNVARNQQVPSGPGRNDLHDEGHRHEERRSQNVEEELRTLDISLGSTCRFSRIIGNTDPSPPATNLHHTE